MEFFCGMRIFLPKIEPGLGVMALPKWKQDMLDRKAREETEQQRLAEEQARAGWIDQLVDAGVEK